MLTFNSLYFIMGFAEKFTESSLLFSRSRTAMPMWSILIMVMVDSGW